MFDDPELVQSFVEESLEHLADIEQELLQIEQQGPQVERELVNKVFRAIHSVKGAAGFLGLTQINQLAHAAEHVLDLIRNGQLAPHSQVIDALLQAADRLTEMIRNVEQSQQYDIQELLEQLHQAAQAGEAAREQQLAADETPPAAESPYGDRTQASHDLQKHPTNYQSQSQYPSQTGQNAQGQGLPSQESEQGEPAHAGQAAPSSQQQQQAEVPGVNRNKTAPFPESKSSSPLPSCKPTDRPASSSSAAETSLRVPVQVLDRLMNLAGELVLSRNQLLQMLDTSAVQGSGAIVAGLDRVTSELQEAVMQTRLQPLGNVLGRFGRVVRDLARKLGKQCQLEITGKEVEVDKSIIEAISDPLTHLVRNALDHGIEPPEQRTAAGKPPEGRLQLRAYHQAGKVCLDVVDDGRGIDPERLKQKALARGLISREQAEAMGRREALQLIFAPGFSTAEQVTDVSGRGVGMDVVRSNIQRLGGTVEVESRLGQGTTVHITLPLTLAIIPSLIVRCGSQRFAVPQVNIVELVRVCARERRERIGQVKGAPVLRLRGALLPLVHLHQVLWNRPAELPGEDASEGPTNVLVLESGQQRYGLVVDGLEDSQEIVVKPLGQHLKGTPCLAGATILGDGHVALILDVAGIAAQAHLRNGQQGAEEGAAEEETEHRPSDTQTVLLFTNHPQEYFAVSMGLVARIERVRREQLQQLGTQQVLQYDTHTLPTLQLDHLLQVKPAPQTERLYVIVFRLRQREVGLLVPELCDVQEVPLEVDTQSFVEPGVMGSVVVGGRTVRLLDLFELAQKAHPEWFTKSPLEETPPADPSQSYRLLVVEDSQFFRTKVVEFLTAAGYQVHPCADGQEAWDWLCSPEAEVDLVVTDIEMPRMNGFELCRAIRQHPRWCSLPVVALTSLSSQEDVRQGHEAGVDDYQVKMDREQLLASIGRLLAGKQRENRPEPAGVC